MFRILYKVLFVLGFTFIFSCSVSEEGDVPLIFDIEKDILISAEEKLEGNTRKIRFTMEYLAGVACEEARLLGYIYHDTIANTILMRVDGITPPCLEEGDFYPELILDTKSLETGVSLIPIQLEIQESIINEGFLKIEKDRYIFYTETELQGIVFPNDTINKIPNGLVWGALHSPSEDSDSLTQIFVDRLHDIGGTTKVPREGLYNDFLVLDDVMIWGDFTLSSFPIPFSLDFSDKELEPIRAVANDFRAEFASQIDSLVIYTYKGEQY